MTPDEFARVLCSRTVVGNSKTPYAAVIRRASTMYVIFTNSFSTPNPYYLSQLKLFYHIQMHNEYDPFTLACIEQVKMNTVVKDLL